MKPNGNRALFAVVVLGGVLSSGRAGAQPADIKDQAGFFSPPAVSKAQEAVKQLKSLYNKDVRVDTFKEVPAAKAAQFKAMSPADKTKYLAGSARSRADTLRIHGIYLFILKDPGHLEIIVDDGTLKKDFVAADRDKLRDLLLAHFKAKTYDKGLEEGIAFIRDRFAERLGPRFPAAVANQVKDYAPFFSKETVIQANQEMKAIHQAYQKDLVIETFRTPPPDRQKQLDGLDAEGRGKIFAAWQRERSQAARVNGIHVLICKEPAKVQVGVDEETLKKAFPAGDRDKLVKVLIEGFRAKKFDQSLRDGVDFVYDALDRNTASPLPPPVAGEVKDHAGLFRPEVVARAAADLKQIKNPPGQDVTIETLRRVAAGDRRKVLALDTKARGEYFRALGKTRAEQSGAQGVWVLICQEPRHVWVGVGPGAQKRISNAECDKLQELLLTRLNANDFGGALQEGVTYLADKRKVTGTGAVAPPSLKSGPVPVPPKVQEEPRTKAVTSPASNEKGKESEPARKFNPMWILWGVLILLGLWIFIGIVRALFGRRSPPVQPAYPPPYQQPYPQPPQAGPPEYGSPRPPGAGFPQPQQGSPAAYGAPRPPPAGAPPGYGPGYGYPQAPPPPQGGGGGGFVSGMLGGMLGGGAGSWLYNKMAGGPSAPPQPGPAPAALPGTGPHSHSQAPSPGSAGTGANFGQEPASPAPGYSSSGGDFDEKPAEQAGYSSSGGDFGAPPAESANSGGGDFGQPEEPASSGGGDFGAPPVESASSGGGDFGQPEEPSGSGGDFGAAPEPVAPEATDNDSAGGDFSSPDSGGGTTGGGDSGGGDFGQPEEPSGGGDAREGDF